MYIVINTETMDFAQVDTKKEAESEYKDFVKSAVEDGFSDVGSVILAKIEREVDAEKIVEKMIASD